LFITCRYHNYFRVNLFNSNTHFILYLHKNKVKAITTHTYVYQRSYIQGVEQTLIDWYNRLYILAYQNICSYLLGVKSYLRAVFDCHTSKDMCVWERERAREKKKKRNEILPICFKLHDWSVKRDDENIDKNIPVDWILIESISQYPFLLFHIRPYMIRKCSFVTSAWHDVLMNYTRILSMMMQSPMV
jgi:hypothetical protein